MAMSEITKYEQNARQRWSHKMKEASFGMAKDVRITYEKMPFFLAVSGVHRTTTTAHDIQSFIFEEFLKHNLVFCIGKVFILA